MRAIGIEVIYVINWRWNDGSGSGTVCALWTQQAADEMLKLLATHGDPARNYAIECIPCESRPGE